MNQNNPNIYKIYEENLLNTRLMIETNAVLSAIFYLITNDIVTTIIVFVSGLLTIKGIKIIEGIIKPNGEIK